MIKNLPEFKALIIRYETITIRAIERKYCNITKLTGFGYIRKCTLCVAIKMDRWNVDPCNGCVWNVSQKETAKRFSCQAGVNGKTYYAIARSTTPNTLLKAYWLRAKHMRSILKKLNIEMP